MREGENLVHIKEKVEIKQAEDYIDAYGNTVKVKGPKKEKVSATAQQPGSAAVHATPREEAHSSPGIPAKHVCDTCLPGRARSRFLRWAGASMQHPASALLSERD